MATVTTQGPASKNSSLAHRAGLVVLLLYALTFVVLSVDIMVRIWSWRGKMTHGNVVTLLFLEAARSGVTAGAIALVMFMLARRTGRAWRALSVAFAFAAAWQAKAFGFAAFPGAFQEKIAQFLNAHHVPVQLQVFLFVSPGWCLACAVAALLYFSVHYPRQRTTDELSNTGIADRSGLMRTNALAGADIGAAFRRMAAYVVAAGWLRGWMIAGLTCCWIVLYVTLGAWLPMQWFSGVLLASVAGLIVTNLRAARSAADNATAATISWLARAGLSAGVLFIFSAIAGIVLPGNAAVIGVLSLALAPAAALVCCWCAVVNGVVQTE